MEYLYHLTNSANLDSIKSQGLSPEFSRSGQGVYFSQDIEHVLAYEGHNGQWDTGIVLRVAVVDLNKEWLKADDADYPDIIGEDYDEDDWKDSLEVSGQCLYEGVLKPSCLEYLNDSGKWQRIEKTA